MSGYRPRRQSARWLDGDCPRGVLAIYDDGPKTLDRFTIFYVPEIIGDEDRGMWIDYLATSETGGFSGHEQMRAYLVADYRFRNAHRARTWSSLPEPVKRMIRADLAPEPAPDD